MSWGMLIGTVNWHHSTATALHVQRFFGNVAYSAVAVSHGWQVPVKLCNVLMSVAYNIREQCPTVIWLSWQNCRLYVTHAWLILPTLTESTKTPWTDWRNLTFSHVPIYAMLTVISPAHLPRHCLHTVHSPWSVVPVLTMEMTPRQSWQ